MNARRFESLAFTFLAAALLLPGLSFYTRAQHAFWPSENLAATLLAPMALAFTLASGRLGRGWSAPKAFLFALMGLWAVSAAFAFRRDLSARELGLWLNYPCVLGAAYALGQDAQRRRKALQFILLAAWIQVAYALVQASGRDPFPWNTLFSGRVSGFLGNPNFLGGHLAMLLPLALVLALDLRAPQPQKRMLRWISFLAMGWALLLTQTRGAMLGAAAGCLATLWICHRAMPGLLWRNRAALGLALGLSLLALLAPLAQGKGSMARLASAFQGDEELGRRLHLMRAAATLAGRHPLLGVGPGNFRIFFPTVQAVGAKPESLREAPFVYSEHAHNDFLQMAADSGWPTALVFAGLWLWLLAGFWRNARDSARRQAVERLEDLSPDALAPQPLLMAGLFGAFLALAIHASANFPFLIQPTGLTAWALAGLGLALANPSQAEAAPRRAAALAVAALAALMGWQQLKLQALEAPWWVGQGELQLNHFDQAGPALFHALDFDRKEDRLWSLYGQVDLGRDMTWNAVGSLKEALRLNPYDFPSRVMLGQAYLKMEKPLDALDALEPGIKLAPNFKDLWRHYAAALYKLGRFQDAADAFDWASKVDPDPASMLDNKAAALGSMGNFPAAIEALQRSAEINPNRANNAMNMAVTYFKMGLKQAALKEIQRAKALSPGNPDIFQLEMSIRGK